MLGSCDMAKSRSKLEAGEGLVREVRPRSSTALWLLCLGGVLALAVISFLWLRCSYAACPTCPSVLDAPLAHEVPTYHVDEEPDTDLQLLHLIWRHGHRAPIKIATYPTDPFKNETYYPYGRGNLIKPGYAVSYELGRFLRQRYDGFLGRVLTRELVHLQSSDKDRTRDSAALVMAGMFPPDPAVQRWGPGLGEAWLPFTPRVLPLQEDGVCGGVDSVCPALKAELGRVKRLPEVADLEKRILNGSDLIGYLEKHSGLNLTDRHMVKGIYDAFTGQVNSGLPLPEWGYTVFPEPVSTVAAFLFSLESFTDLQKRLVAGALLHRILSTSSNLVSRDERRERRLYAYSSHDHVILAVLGALGAVRPERPPYPPYAAVLAFELHRHRHTGQLGFKILYRNDTTQPIMHRISIPNCGFFCPIERFSELLSHIIIPLEQQREECFAEKRESQGESRGESRGASRGASRAVSPAVSPAVSLQAEPSSL